MAQRSAHMISSLERTYGQALLELAEQKGLPLAELTDEVRQVRQLVQDQPDLVRLVSTRTISVDQRRQIIERLFRSRISDLLYRFIQTVNAKNRLDQLRGILDAFAMLSQQKRGMVDVDAYVAATLDPSAASRVADGIGQALSKQVQLHQHEDPSLIGGLKLRIGDRLIDGSVAAQLRLMRKRMVDGGREKSSGLVV